MIVEVVRSTECVRDAHHLEPLGSGIHLVRADLHGAHFVVENLGCRAGQGAETGGAQPGAGSSPAAMPSVLAPCQTSSGEKACTCMSGAACFTIRQISR
jgi:hypothetical protein